MNKSIAASGAPANGFAAALKTHRRNRRASQLDLALSAGISQRHVSFLETGRAQPSRGMVLALGAALALTLDEQNGLLLAAGFAPVFRPEGRTEAELQLVRRALDAILLAHAPFPAILLDQGDIVIKANAGADKLATALAGAPFPPGISLSQMILSPSPLRERIENWPELAVWTIRAAAREGRPLSMPVEDLDVRRLMRRDPDKMLPAALQLVFKLDGGVRLSLLSIMAGLMTPLDSRIESLKIELFAPADDATAAWFKA